LLNKADLDAEGFSFFNPTYIFYMACTFSIMLVLSSITQEGSRKLTVLSPKQILGRDISLTKSSYIPIRFGQAGVVPIIFSSSILLFFSGLIKKSENIFPIVNSIGNPYLNQFIYFAAFLTIIVLFSSFYSLILLNPEDIAKNLSKMSSVIQDIKPGVKTRIYLRKSILEASFIGALLLSFLIIIPFLSAVIFNVPSFSISGITSMILCLSIINDTARQILAYFETRVFLFIP
jgi:preprotein translocase subunit SecY